MPEESGINLQSQDPLALLEERIGRPFSRREVLERALTHRSFVHEYPQAALRQNESMEFLGDSILGFIISEELFRRFPQAAEGSLSKAKAYLVSAANLQRMARSLDLGQFLRLSSGEEKTGGRKKRALLVDAYEALIAAIYLDGGVDAARQFILLQFREALEIIDVERVRYEDFKSTLQERLHLLRMPEPIYEVVEEQGPDHAKTFVVQLIVQGEVIARAAGKTKKEAQQLAAQEALRTLAAAEHCSVRLDERSQADDGDSR
jgi:ribonuclease III